MLNGGVNGTNWPERTIASIGCSRSLAIVPSFKGTSASVGVSEQVPTIAPPRLQRTPERGDGGQGEREVDRREVLREVGLDAVHRLELVVGQWPADQLLEAAERDAHVRAPDRAELGAERRVFECRRPCDLDVMAERFEELAHGLRRVGALRIAGSTLRMMIEDADAELAGVGAELVDVRPSGCGCDHGVADARASHRVEQRRGVAHGPADTELDRQAALLAERVRA